MSLDETPWNDIHHCSSFLLSLSEIPSCLESFVSYNPTCPLQTLVLVHEVLSKGNMGNITATMPLDICIKPGIVENIHIGVSCSPNEIKVFIDFFKEFCDVFTHPNPRRMARPKGEERTQHLRTFSPGETSQDAQSGSTISPRTQ